MTDAEYAPAQDISPEEFEQAVRRIDDGILAAYLPAEMNFTEVLIGVGVALTIEVVRPVPGGVREILVDIVPEGELDPPMKFYRVRQWARQLGLGFVDPIWSGNAQDFKLADLPAPHECDMVLHLRRYSRGPWFMLQNPASSEPKEKPQPATRTTPTEM